MYKFHKIARRCAYIILFIACLPMAYAHVESADKYTAEDRIERFYGFVFFKGQSPNFNELASVKDYFDPDFYSDLITLMKVSGKHEILDQQLAFIPFTGVQDSAEGFVLKNSVNSKQNQNAIQIPVAFLFRSDQVESKKQGQSNVITEGWKVTVSLIKKDNNSEWKINDIIYHNGSPNLSILAKEAAQYIKSHHIKEDAEGYYRW